MQFAVSGEIEPRRLPGDSAAGTDGVKWADETREQFPRSLQTRRKINDDLCVRRANYRVVSHASVSARQTGQQRHCSAVLALFVKSALIESTLYAYILKRQQKFCPKACWNLASYGNCCK